MSAIDRVDLSPGAVLLRGFVAREEQAGLVDQCMRLGESPAGFYRPKHKSGGTMSVAMMCLGMHWNARTYAYEPTRSDHDHLPVQPLPSNLRELSQRAAGAAGMAIEPDICLVNHYDEGARLGLHCDSDERPETRAAGIPIVSVSLGRSARYVLGGLRRADPTQPIELRSGDVIVLGGPSRMRFHGVEGLIAGTCPGWLPDLGRLNLTFRQY